MSSLAKIIGIISISILLSACARLGIKNNDNQYLKATTIPPTYIPSNLSSSSIEAYYPVPPATSNQQPGKVVIIPPGSVKPPEVKKHWWHWW